MKSLNQYITEYVVKQHVNSKKTSKEIQEDIKSIEDYLSSQYWEFSDPKNCKYKITEDEGQYFIESFGHCRYKKSGNLSLKSFETYFTDTIDRYNKQTNHYCPHFIWKSHDMGSIVIPENLQNLQSIDGLPDDIDILFIDEMCSVQNKNQLDLGKRNINIIRLMNNKKITLTGSPKVNEIRWLGYNGAKPKITFNCKNMHKE